MDFVEVIATLNLAAWQEARSSRRAIIFYEKFLDLRQHDCY